MKRATGPDGLGRRAACFVIIMALSVLPTGFAGAHQTALAGPSAQAEEEAQLPIQFPRDDGPHPAPLEWWYYTGHLFTETGERYGFEFVVFKGERDGLTGLASHVAITDSARGRFVYDQRLVVGDGVAADVADGVFDLCLDGWCMNGANGEDRLNASIPGYAFSLQATAVKPPALHRGDGFLDYGARQYTYYYSRTRLEITGTLRVDGDSLSVTGIAWMDHQWGDFRTYAEGGWDWFALQLDDGWDLMLYVLNAPDGTPILADGSLVAPDGALTVLDGGDFATTPTGQWTSLTTGVTYPSGWTVELPAAALTLTLTPTLRDQELDTTASTGQIYWEGEVEIAGTRGGEPVGGLGYVELTGYANRSGTPEAMVVLAGSWAR